jgi:hypothetical protein
MAVARVSLRNCCNPAKRKLAYYAVLSNICIHYYTRYAKSGGREQKTLREYLTMWAGHLTHWIAEAGDTPLIVFRYEDLLWRPAEVPQRTLLHTTLLAYTSIT